MFKVCKYFNKSKFTLEFEHNNTTVIVLDLATREEVEDYINGTFANVSEFFTGTPTCPHCGTKEFLCGHNGVGCTSDKNDSK